MGIYCSWLDIRLVSTIFAILQCIFFLYEITSYNETWYDHTDYNNNNGSNTNDYSNSHEKRYNINADRIPHFCSLSVLCHGIGSEMNLVEIEDIIFWQQLKLLLLLFRLLKLDFFVLDNLFQVTTFYITIVTITRIKNDVMKTIVIQLMIKWFVWIFYQHAI